MNNQTRKWAALLLLPAALWLEVIRQLSIEWTVNPQYTYGWSVPFLALYLFFLRRKDRPSAETFPPGDPSAPVSGRGCWILLWALLAVFLPIRVVQESNPGWRLVGWVMSLEVIGLSMCLVYLAGGARWARHFAFPILFFLVSVPWPSGLENLVIQNLTKANAAVSVELLNMLGVAAAQRGNVIEVATGVVGIDEACSGIRSFQAALMIALFLGEWNRFRWKRRWALLGGAVGVVFLANLVRTCFLVWVAVKKSVGAIAKWHDPAGVSVLVIAFGLIWAVAGWLKGFEKKTGGEAAGGTAEGGGRPWPRGLVAGGLIWLVICEVATAAWFKSHERMAERAESWTVNWPERAAAFHDRGFTKPEQELLRYTEGRAASWSEREGMGWLVFFLRWRSPQSLADRVVAHDALMHAPDICLPGVGFRIVADDGIRMFQAGRIQMRFRRQRFEGGGVALYVFHCVWEDVLSKAPEREIDWMETNSWRATRLRLRRALDGKRYNGIRMLEIVLAGPKSQKEADEQLEKRLQGLVKEDTKVEAR